jgi:hypothetical protein
MNDRKGLSRRNSKQTITQPKRRFGWELGHGKINRFWGLHELGNRIILKHRLLLVIGGEGGRLRSDRASTAKGFVFVKKPYPTRF